MANIGFLGFGAMGSRMVSHLAAAGHKVRVWNRSSAALDAIKHADISVAKTPAEAAHGAEFVFSMVRDNEASEYVWLDETSGAINGLNDSAIAVECSTLTPNYIKKLRTKLSDNNVALVDAPVVGSTPQAEAGKLVFLVGAQSSEFLAVEPMLKSMALAVHHAGENGCGSTIKLAVNALFALQVAGIAELMGYLKDSNVALDESLAVISSLPIASPAMKVSAEAMLAGHFAPAFPVELVAKDLSYLCSSSDLVSTETPISNEIWQLFQRAQEQGFGDENITAIARLFI